MNPGEIRAIIASSIRAERARKDIGQVELAEQMRDCGHDAWIRQTVSNAEKGRRRVTADELVTLAALLGVPVGRLLP